MILYCVQDFRVTLYPGKNHKEHSRPKDRICHITSKADDHVKIGKKNAETIII